MSDTMNSGGNAGGLSVILRSDDYESAHYALALAAAALAVNKPAVLFFTMAGIRALEGPPPPLADWHRDAVNRKAGVGDFETLLEETKPGMHLVTL